MKITLFLSTIFLIVTLSTSISLVRRSSIIENFKQSLYHQLNPIFQNTFDQLKGLADELTKKISQSTKTRFTREDSSDWMSGLFEGSGSITNQWNDQINQFFQNIPTVYENDDRSLFDRAVFANKLRPAVKNLVQKLRKLFDMEINRMIVQSNTDLHPLLRDFQNQVSRVFDNTEERINQTIENFFQSISNYLNRLNG